MEFLILLLLLFQAVGTTSTRSVKFDNSSWTIESTERWWALLGGKEIFEAEMEKISAHATSLRNGQLSKFERYVFLGQLKGFVGQLCFEDGICWATKLIGNATKFRGEEIDCAIRAMEAMTTYCPEVPIPRYHGRSGCEENDTFCYYFMDWISGKTLSEVSKGKIRDITEGGLQTGRYEFKLLIPEKVVTQLASFAHNLTTCPIPAGQST
jgi:hypothetical protein